MDEQAPDTIGSIRTPEARAGRVRRPVRYGIVDAAAGPVQLAPTTARRSAARL